MGNFDESSFHTTFGTPNGNGREDLDSASSQSDSAPSTEETTSPDTSLEVSDFLAPDLFSTPANLRRTGDTTGISNLGKHERSYHEHSTSSDSGSIVEGVSIFHGPRDHGIFDGTDGPIPPSRPPLGDITSSSNTPQNTGANKRERSEEDKRIPFSSARTPQILTPQDNGKRQRTEKPSTSLNGTQLFPAHESLSTGSGYGY